MPLAFVCRRCGWHGFGETRLLTNVVANNHFLKSHKRTPFPLPEKMEKVTVSNPIAVSDDYTMHLLRKEEFEEIQVIKEIPAFWKALRTKPF